MHVADGMGDRFSANMSRYSSNNWMAYSLIYISVFIILIYGNTATLIVVEPTQGAAESDSRDDHTEQKDFSNLANYTEQAKADFVSDLPGFGSPKSNTFAGLDTFPLIQ